MKTFVLLSASFVQMLSLIVHGMEPLVFPADGGVLDVRNHGGRPDDDGDDTAAIQKALDAHPNGNRIIYLAPGVWRVSDTLRWPKGEGGNGEKRTILQGAGRDHTTLLLPERTPGFDKEPRAMIWTGNKPAQRFRNAVRDLTVEIGPENPQAIALQFNASNQGCIRNVTLRASKDSGLIGLDMGFTDEIGPLLVRGLVVEGFETGIVTKWPVNSITFEDITLRSQRKLVWHNYHQMIFVRGLRSESAVTTLFNEKDSWGTVCLLDSRLAGLQPGPQTPGILNQRGLYLRNVAITGYPVSVDNADKGRDKGDITGSGTIAEDTSHANVHGLFRDISDHTFATAGKVTRLPVKETPEVPWGDPAREWVNLEAFGAMGDGRTDASGALQRAIDTGATTIYLPAGREFFFNSEVMLHGPARRIIGLEGRIHAGPQAVWRFTDSGAKDAPVLIIERMSGRSGGHSIQLQHESARTLVVSSVIGFAIEGCGSGDLFADDFCGELDLLQSGQSAWCRQLNIERPGTKCRNLGGRLWILGMKTEKTGTLIETRNGGITDATGIFLYANQGWQEGEPAFLIEDASAVLCGINDRNFNQRPVSPWVREIRSGDAREMKEKPWVYLSR